MTIHTQVNTSKQNILAQYVMSEQQKIVVKKEKGTLQSYIQTKTSSDQKITEKKIELKYPQGFDSKQLAESSDKKLQKLLQDDFYINKINSGYELLPRLKGGGGFCCKPMNIDARQPRKKDKPPAEMSSKDKVGLSGDKILQLKNYLINRDDYPKAQALGDKDPGMELEKWSTQIEDIKKQHELFLKGNPEPSKEAQTEKVLEMMLPLIEETGLKGIYKDLATDIIEDIITKDNDKLNQSEKNFGLYLDVRLAELENKKILEKLGLTIKKDSAEESGVKEHKPQADVGKESNTTLVSVLSKLTAKTQSLFPNDEKKQDPTQSAQEDKQRNAPVEEHKEEPQLLNPALNKSEESEEIEDSLGPDERSQTAQIDATNKAKNLVFPQPQKTIQSETTSSVNHEKAELKELHLANYQTKILERWILQIVLQKMHPGEDVTKSPFYQKFAQKLAHLCAKAKDSSEAAIQENLVKYDIENLHILEAHEQTPEDAKIALGESGKSIYLEKNLEKLSEAKWANGLRMLEKQMLRRLPWQEYTTTLLVKHYNLITNNGTDQNPTNLTDLKNKLKIEEITRSILLVYQDLEDNLTADQFGELVALGGIKHHVHSHEAPLAALNLKKLGTSTTNNKHQIPVVGDAQDLTNSLFHDLLGRLVVDIKNDELFEPSKIRAMAFLIAQARTNVPLTEEKKEQWDALEKELKTAATKEEKAKIIEQMSKLRTSPSANCRKDDLKSCLDALKTQLDRLLFTAENTNTHEVLDSINLLLNVMGLQQVKGLTEGNQDAFKESLKAALPSIMKRGFNFVRRQVDPSLEYKAKYAEEALKRIDPEDTAYTSGEKLIVSAGPAIFSIVKGAFTGETDSMIDDLKEVGAALKECYDDMDKDWFDQINDMQSLSNVDFELFEEKFFGEKGFFNKKTPKAELLFFTANQLDQIARNRHRSYKDRRRSIELLGNLHSQCWYWDKHIRFWIHRQLSAIGQKPTEDIAPYDTSLREVAQHTMHNLYITPMPIKQEFEFTDPKLTSGNSLLKTALKNHLTLDHALSELQQLSYSDYERSIKRLHLIEIEGDKYTSGNKTADKPINLQKDGLTAFINEAKTPVWLIQGDAGTGKSIFLKLIEKKLWNQYKQGKAEYIPIFVRLSEVKNPGRCIEEMLQNMHYSKRIIQKMKENDSKYLFIFDGYDELKAPKNLYKVNKLEEFGEDTKMIITSREEYLKAYGNYQKYFKPESNSQLFEHRITDVTEKQRNIYLKKAVKSNNEKYLHLDSKADKREKEQLKPWTEMKAYTHKINKIQGLNDLIKTPYMLKIIIDILPQLDKQSEGDITKASIYKAFTTSHFEKEANRLLENSAQDIPKGYDLETSFYNYSKDLAMRMWLLDKTSIESESGNFIVNRSIYKNFHDQQQKEEKSKKSDAKSFNEFFATDRRTSLARAGAQIIVLDSQARFSHKSIMEYFASRFLYEDLKNFKTEEYKETFNIKLLKGSSETDQESDVLNFLVEMIKDNDHQQTALKLDGSDEKGVHITEYLKEVGKDSAKFQGDCNHVMQNILQVSCHFPDVIAVIKDDAKKAIENNEKLNLSLRADFCKAITKEFYSRFESSKKQEDETLYKEYAQKSINYELKGKYSGPYKTEDKTGLWIADTSESQEKGTIEFTNGDQYSGSWLNNKFEGEGHYTYSNHTEWSEYQGSWSLGAFSGEGTLTYKKAMTFTGSFDKGQKHGEGSFEFSACSDEKWKEVKAYKGVWKQGNITSGSLFLSGLQPSIQSAEESLFEVQGTLNPQGFKPDIEDVVRLYDAKQTQKLKKMVNVLSNPFETQTGLKKTAKGNEICLAIGLQAYPEGCFGPKEWETYFGQVEELLPLPKNINEILNSPCPYWTNKKVKDTHLLTIIPNFVNEKKLNHSLFRELIKKPKIGAKSDYDCFDVREFDKAIDSTEWVLFLKDVIPNSRNKTFEEQKSLIKKGYTLPSSIEASISIFTNYAKNQEVLYPNKYPRTYFICSEISKTKGNMFLGCFDHDAQHREFPGMHAYLDFVGNSYKEEQTGISAIKKLKYSFEDIEENNIFTNLSNINIDSVSDLNRKVKEIEKKNIKVYEWYAKKLISKNLKGDHSGRFIFKDEKFQAHGEGELTNEDGTCFKGKWKENKKEGSFKLTFEGKEDWKIIEYYEGDYINNYLKKGMLNLKNGKKIECNFCDIKNKFKIEKNKIELTLKLIKENNLNYLFNILENIVDIENHIIENPSININVVPEKAFGPIQWKDFFGEVTDVPDLPKNINNILDSHCPYFENKKISETHILCLIPQKLNGENLTHSYLNSLIKSPKKGFPASYDRFDVREFDKAIDSTEWVLFLKDVIPNSRNKTFEEQKSLIKEGYTIPKSIEASVSIFTHYIRTKEILYPNRSLRTYTICEEIDGYDKLFLGCLDANGKMHTYFDYVNSSYKEFQTGIGAIRKL